MSKSPTHRAEFRRLLRQAPIEELTACAHSVLDLANPETLQKLKSLRRQTLEPPVGRADLAAKAWRRLAVVGGAAAIVAALVLAVMMVRIVTNPSRARAANARSKTLSAVAEQVRAEHWTIEPRFPLGIAGAVWNNKGEVAYGTNTGQLRVVDAHNLQKIKFRLVGHETQIAGLSWRPGGDRVASSNQDGLVRLWFLPRNGQKPPPPKILDKHEYFVNYLHFSPDGRYLASMDKYGILCLWDADGELIRTVKAYPEPGRQYASVFAWSPDSKRIVTVGGGWSATVKLWTVAGEPIATLAGPFHDKGNGISKIAWSPDGQWIAAIRARKTVTIWPAAAPFEKQERIRSGKVIHSLHWLSSDRLLVETSGLLTEWTRDGRVQRSVSIGENRVSSYNRDGTLFTAVWKGRLRIVSAQDGTVVDELPTGQPVITAIAGYHPQGRYFVTGELTGRLRFWDGDGRLSFTQHRHAHPVLQIAFDPSGQWLVTGDDMGRVLVWNAEGRFHVELPPHGGKINFVQWSPSGGRLITGSQDETIRVWRREELLDATPALDRAIELFDPQKRGNPISMAWLSETSFLAGYAKLKGIVRWSTEGGFRRYRTRVSDPNVLYYVVRDYVFDLGARPDGQTFVATSSYGNVTLWDAARFEKPLVSNNMDAHFGDVISVQWSADSRNFVTGGRDGRVWIWDREGASRRRLEKDRVGVTQVRFSPDETIIAAADDGGKLWLWRANGQRLGLLKGHFGGVKSFVWNPNSQRIVTTDEVGMVRVWDVQDFRLISATLIHLAGPISFDGQGRQLSGDSSVLEHNYTYCAERGGQARVLQPQEFHAVAPPARSR